MERAARDHGSPRRESRRSTIPPDRTARSGAARAGVGRSVGLLLALAAVVCQSLSPTFAAPALGPYPATPSLAAALTPVAVDPQTMPIVAPVLFIPKGLASDPAYLPGINASVASVAAWYARELHGHTFTPVPARVVAGQFPLTHYCPKTIDPLQCIQIPGKFGADSGDVYNVLSDLASQGLPIRSGVVTLIFWVGGYGYAAGANSGRGSGFAAVADWALTGASGARYVENRCGDLFMGLDPCTRERTLGVIAHELGHAFGLPHPTDDGRPPTDPDYFGRSVMSSELWDFPNGTFIDSTVNPERTTLLANPQIRATVDPVCPPAAPPGALAIGSFTVGAVCGSQPDAYLVAGSAGDTVHVAAGGVPPADPRLELLATCTASAPTVVAEGASALTAVLPCSGVYELEVTSPAGSGAYGLLVYDRGLDAWPGAILSLSAGAAAITWGRTLRLSATARGGGLQAVELDSSSDGLTWKVAATTATDTEGHASFTQQPVTNCYYRLVLAGDGGDQGINSQTVRVMVRQTARLRPSSSLSVRRGTSVSFSATVRPAGTSSPSMVTYALYRLSAGTWVRVRTTRVLADSAGVARLRWTFAAVGIWGAKAMAGSTIANASSAWTPLVRVAVN